MCLIILTLFSLVVVVIQSQSSMSGQMIIVKFVESLLDRVECTASFKAGARKDNVLNAVLTNNVLNGRPENRFPDIAVQEKKSAGSRALAVL